MTVENNDTTPVDVNTDDDLDAFSQDFFQLNSDNDANDSTGAEKNDSPATEEATTEEEVEENLDEVSEDDVSEDTEEEKKAFIPKKKKTFQERINEVIAKQRELERELEAERAKNRAKEEVTEPTPTPTAKVEDDRPNPDATNEDGTPKYPLGDFDPSYISDLHIFLAEKSRREIDEAAAKIAEEKAIAEAQEALQTEWQGKIAEADEVYEDFRESVAVLEQKFANVDQQYGEYLASTIMAMPKGADVLYYLSQHPEEAEAIVNSGPARATIALGELHGMFKQERQKPLKKVSQAPEPPVSLNKGRKVTMEVPDDTDDLEAFEKKFFKR